MTNGSSTISRAWGDAEASATAKRAPPAAHGRLQLLRRRARQPYALLGSVHVLEGMSAACRPRRERHPEIVASERRGFSYLCSHGELDVLHVEFFNPS